MDEVEDPGGEDTMKDGEVMEPNTDDDDDEEEDVEEEDTSL